MRSLYYLLSCIMIAMFAAWSYNVNYATRSSAADIAALKISIDAEREKLAILRAEWNYLNRPERLLRLAEANFETLELVPLNVDNLARADQIAYPIGDIDKLVELAVMTSSNAPLGQ